VDPVGYTSTAVAAGALTGTTTTARHRPSSHHPATGHRLAAGDAVLEAALRSRAKVLRGKDAQSLVERAARLGFEETTRPAARERRGLKEMRLPAAREQRGLKETTRPAARQHRGLKE
jgi:hypothetical protein